MNDNVGAWLIGAYGSVATCVAAGLEARKLGVVDTAGMLCETPACAGLDIPPLDGIVVGGCDIRSGALADEFARLAQQCTGLSADLTGAVAPCLKEVESRIVTGTTANSGEAIARLCDDKPAAVPLRQEVENISRQLARFKKEQQLEEVVVVNLASTEPILPPHPGHRDGDAFERLLDNDEADVVRAGSLYAYAAVREGCPYINFTPANSALLPAIIDLAVRSNVPVMGSDGKTGETLVKSALAPMFRYRNLEVLSWEGINLLGNRDGEVLDHPDNKATKIASKDRTLRKVLGYDPHTSVGINYVPSLGDRKTAWDFIHFRGFMGVTMSMEFVWQGMDSFLAAPLVIDLIRLAVLAKRRREGGLMPHLGLFFKAPVGGEEYCLAEQYQRLQAYLDGCRRIC